MSDDLVKRLRETSGQYDDHGWHSDIELEAADRIERLEAALEKVAAHDMQAIAMDALRPGERIRGKKDV